MGNHDPFCIVITLNIDVGLFLVGLDIIAVSVNF